MDKPRSAQQWRAVFTVPGHTLDARQIRLDLEHAGVVPRDLTDAMCYFGHRHSLNISALTPLGNGIADCANDIAMWLAERYQTFVPTNVEAHTLTFERSRPYGYTIPALALARSGKDWERAQRPQWQMEYVARRFAADIQRQIDAWGLKLSVPEATFEPIKRTLAVTMPIRGKAPGQTATTTALVAANVRFTTNLQMLGLWAIGPLQGLGMGRTAFEAPMMSVNEQMEELQA
jgi:hypothetical protein